MRKSFLALAVMLCVSFFCVAFYPHVIASAEVKKGTSGQFIDNMAREVDQNVDDLLEDYEYGLPSLDNLENDLNLEKVNKTANFEINKNVAESADEFTLSPSLWIICFCRQIWR